MSAAAPTHTTESIADRKKTRELAEARQSGAVAPQVDVKTGSMINPHNPEFITKRPWYLGDNDAGPSLDHQADQRLDKDRVELSMASADAIVRQERQLLKEQQKKQEFQVGMWVEATKNGKGPYRICQITKIAKKGTQFDLKYEDGAVELKVKLKKNMFKPRIRMTKTGSRAVQIDAAVHGKETFDSKRDKYHGYDPETHTQRVERVYNERQAIRKQVRERQGEGKTKDQKKKEKEEQNNNNGSDSDSDLDSDVGSDSDDEFVQKDEDDKVITTRLGRQGGVGGAQMKVTARNLRIREDTAKYLRNLDPNSAYYDPKSRSMRDNPNPEVTAEELQFAGFREMLSNWPIRNSLRGMRREREWEKFIPKPILPKPNC
jgi:pre-mRNA-processing factor SLU7